MKTPVLIYSNKRTKDVLKASIQKYVQIITELALDRERAEDVTKNLCYNLCYSAFNVSQVRFKEGSRYTIADVCQGIKGLFQNNMIDLLHNLIRVSEDRENAGTYTVLLHDCLSYELIQMLYGNPAEIYAAVMYTFARLVEDEGLMQVAYTYLSGPRVHSTLAWEDLYKKYMERYGNL